MSNDKIMEWKVHPSFPFYDVSEYGDVRTNVARSNFPKFRRLRGTINKDGYIFYKLEDTNGEFKHIPAHKLVLETFSGLSDDPSLEVRHLNGSRLANHFSNLQWSTRKENHEDLQIHGTHCSGERNGRATIDENMVRKIRALGEYEPCTKIANMLGLPYHVTRNVVARRTWKYVV